MIRRYKESDVDEVLEVWFQASTLAHPFLEPAFVEQEKKNIRDLYIPNTETWVFEASGKVIGFISMMGNEVGAIFLHPQYHGKGIGRKLMDVVAALHEELVVDVFKENRIGRRFYDGYGFVFLKEHLHEATNQLLIRMKYSIK